MHILMPSDYLLDRSVIDSNVDYKKLTPAIEEVQDLKIRPLLGTNLYNLIITQSSTAPLTLSVPNATLLNDYVLKTMLNFICAAAPLYLKYRYMNKGILSANPEGHAQADLAEIKHIEAKFTTSGQAYADLTIEYIKANPTLFPKYFDNNGTDQELPGDAYNTDIYTPGSANRNQTTAEQNG